MTELVDSQILVSQLTPPVTGSDALDDLRGQLAAATAPVARLQFDKRFRDERKNLEALLDPTNDAESPLAPALAVLDRRAQELAPVIAELAKLQEAGSLTSTLPEMASSFVHMHVNRMIRSAQRAHELAIYDLLFEIYAARAAREKGRRRCE